MAVAGTPCTTMPSGGRATAPSGSVVVGERRTETPGSAVHVTPSPAWRMIDSRRRASSSMSPVDHTCHGWQDRARAGQHRSNTSDARAGVMKAMTTLDSYVTLGRSGLRVSPLALGTMTFGDDGGWGTSPETAAAVL